MLQQIRFYSILILGTLLMGLAGLSSARAQGQPGSIRGTITDAQTGEALPGANVIIQGTSRGAATNPDGNYRIGVAPAGQHTLVVTYLGYQKVERQVTVESGEELVVDFELQPQSVEGEEVVVSAQAQGQRQAMNQQISSNTISDVVSEARIKELPDVNAAESVGRLPGVSIERSGGEATKVAIRGLSPKYNTITVNGIRLPATDPGNRSVNLSIISSNMLDGIEVKKAVTPDMDADALGGSVNLRLKEAPDKRNISASVQGGYNNLKRFMGNYKVNLSFSDRFLDKRLGVMMNFNADTYNRSSNTFNGNYYETRKTGSDEIVNQVASVYLQENNVTRGRTGGSVMLDYSLPNGKVTFSSFYNRLENNALNHQNGLDIRYGRHQYQLTDDPNSVNEIFNTSLGVQKDFTAFQVDASVSSSSTVADNPKSYLYQFVQEYSAFDGTVTPDTHPTEIMDMVTYDSTQTLLSNMYMDSNHRNEFVQSTQLNIKVPFRFGDKIDGYLKTGGKLRWLQRMNEEERIGRNGFQYGGGLTILRSMDEVDPALGLYDIATTWEGLPMFFLANDYYRPHFLDGDYGDQPLGPSPSLPLMQRLWRDMSTAQETLRYSIESLGNDYEGIERYQAAYVMAEINLGDLITVIPGVRYERNYTRYDGPRFREVVISNVQRPPGDYEILTRERENEYWLPMVQMQIKPASWLKLRLSRTETLTRPDFIQYAPNTRISSDQTSVQAANSSLTPARATNYDAAMSIYQSKIGLFSANVFYKEIDDLIFWTQYYLSDNIDPLPGMNVPPDWYKGAQPSVNTYINNPYETTYKGFELSWQTNFWYMPGIMKGLVLDVNFSRIYSETTKQLYNLGFTQNPKPPFNRVFYVKDTTRTARMPDQPKYVANVTLGFDHGGFSARLSYLYQTDKVTGIARDPRLDQFTGTYARFDLALKQRLPNGLEIFANLNNLNNRKDKSYIGTQTNRPTYIENYGFTVDVGARISF